MLQHSTTRFIVHLILKQAAALTTTVVWQNFYTLDALPVTQPTASKH